MYSIVYISTASKPFSDEQLDALLEESRDWNKQAELTGLLLYKDGYFMQFLEGEEKEVLYILNKIRNDPRHHSLIVLLHQNQPEREFASWSMGFERLFPADDRPAGFTDLWELPFSSEEFLVDPTRSLQFLLSFKKVPR